MKNDIPNLEQLFDEYLQVEYNNNLYLYGETNEKIQDCVCQAQSA